MFSKIDSGTIVSNSITTPVLPLVAATTTTEDFFGDGDDDDDEEANIVDDVLNVDPNDEEDKEPAKEYEPMNSQNNPRKKTIVGKNRAKALMNAVSYNRHTMSIK